MAPEALRPRRVPSSTKTTSDMNWPRGVSIFLICKYDALHGTPWRTQPSFRSLPQVVIHCGRK